MYYEERIIGGVLHRRSRQKDTWTPKTPEELTKMLQELRQRIYG